MSDQVNTTDNASPRYEGPQLSVAGSAESLVRGGGGMSGSDAAYYFYFSDGE